MKFRNMAVQEVLFRVLRFFLKGILSLLLVMFLYIVIALIGSAIPVHTKQPPGGEITIFLRSNGVHTSFIFPMENEVTNWHKLVDPEDSRTPPTNTNYISFGWGDLAFYQHTPEWSDLTFPVAFQAVFLSKPSALHVEFHDRIRYSQPTLPIKVTQKQYQELSKYVRDSFKRDALGDVRPVAELHYNQHDAFYLAERSLHFFYTCNTWVNEGLKAAGLRACLWTPFDEGLFYQYR